MVVLPFLLVTGCFLRRKSSRYVLFACYFDIEDKAFTLICSFKIILISVWYADGNYREVKVAN